MNRYLNVLLFSLLFGMSCQEAFSQQRPGAGVCGPRSIDFLLDWYDKPSPGVSALCMQLQPEIHKGMPLEDLMNYLNEQGISTRVVSVPKGSLLQVSRPAIVCRDNPSDPNRLGHYVVLLPHAAKRNTEIWDPAINVQTMKHESELFENASTPVVLTTTGNPTNLDYIAQKSRYSRFGSRDLVFFSIAVLCIGLTIVWSKRNLSGVSQNSGTPDDRQTPLNDGV